MQTVRCGQFSFLQLGQNQFADDPGVLVGALFAPPRPPGCLLGIACGFGAWQRLQTVRVAQFSLLQLEQCQLPGVPLCPSWKPGGCVAMA